MNPLFYCLNQLQRLVICRRRAAGDGKNSSTRQPRVEHRYLVLRELLRREDDLVTAGDGDISPAPEQVSNRIDCFRQRRCAQRNTALTTSGIDI